ncbi:MAG: hypothetical protein Q8O67_23565 [Deltaproteobacteria bacterium]|nr:hypothetical protein [Deltaproteobacteria bacterium]
MLHRVVVVVVSLGAVGLVAACEVVDVPPTYASVKPFLDTKCGNCHRPAGIGPMSLLAYDEVLLFKESIGAVVADGSMPPWPAVDGCNDYANDLRLSDDEKATLQRWLEDGAPEGDPVDPGSAESALAASSIVRADLVLEAASEGFAPSRDDEYRCFAVAVPTPDNGEEVYITGFDVVPGAPHNVHHVNVYMNPPLPGNDFIDWVGLDDEDPLPGYNCSRGERVITTFLVGAWAPGSTGMLYPAGTGQLIEPGSVIVMEVHYGFGDDVPDLTSLVLQTAPTVERRGLGVAFWKFDDWEEDGMVIPAGADDVTHSVDVDPGIILATVAPWLTQRSLEISVAALHMHQLGKSGELKVLSPVGDTCMVRVENWDFRWQFGYEMRKPAPFFVGEDKLHLSCTWDNTEANQGFVDGEQQPSIERNWGGRTEDEMCIGFLFIVPAPE